MRKAGWVGGRSGASTTSALSATLRRWGRNLIRRVPVALARFAALAGVFTPALWGPSVDIPVAAALLVSYFTVNNSAPTARRRAHSPEFLNRLFRTVFDRYQRKLLPRRIAGPAVLRQRQQGQRLRGLPDQVPWQGVRILWPVPQKNVRISPPEMCCKVNLWLLWW